MPRPKAVKSPDIAVVIDLGSYGTKVLGVLWVLQQELELPAKFTVALSVLLPPGEYADRARFKTHLMSALKGYGTPSGQITASLTHLVCLPEGGGVVLHRRRNDPQFNQKTVVVSIMGGRNASVLIYEEGVEAASYTSDLGFIDLVRGVVQRTSGMDVETLIPLIAKAGSQPMPYHFVKAARRTNEAERQQELVALVAAVKAARGESFARLIAWYREVLPPHWDEFIFCGGTADYYKDDLVATYSKPSSGQTVWFHGGIKLPESLNDLGLGVRLYDPYAAFDHLLAIVLPQSAQSVEVAHG